MTKVTVVGLGLIGGSIAKDLRAQMNLEVTGVDASETHCEKALDLGLVDAILPIEDAVKTAEIIIVAIPVNAIEKIVPSLLNQMSERAVLIDVGSTKEEICKAVSGHPKRGRFVAAHPLAGTEFSGPEAAISRLFQDKKNIVCEKEKIDKDALKLALKLFFSLGMETFYLSPEAHDMHLAYVSHLSHISSFTLSLTVLDIEKDESQIFNLASTGFESTARLAKSSPATWAPIFNKNAKHLSRALEQYITYLNAFKEALDNQNPAASFDLMKQANKIKKVLKNK